MWQCTAAILANRRLKRRILVNSRQSRIDGKFQASQGYIIKKTLSQKTSKQQQWEKSTNFRQRELSIARMCGQITYLGKLFSSLFHHRPCKLKFKYATKLLKENAREQTPFTEEALNTT